MAIQDQDLVAYYETNRERFVLPEEREVRQILIVVDPVSSLMGVIALAERHNLHDSLLRATINLGYALDPDDPEAAYRVSRDGAAKARQWGQRLGLRYLVGNAVNGAIMVGDWDWALGEVRDPIWEDGEPAERIWLGSGEAEILAGRGEPVVDLIAEIKDLAAGFDDPQYRGNAINAEWMAMLASGRYVEIIEPGRASLAWAGQGGVDYVPPLVCRAALRAGDADVIREMLGVFAGTRMGRVATACLAAMAGALASVEGRRADARAQYLEALRLFREIGLAWVAANTGLDAIVADALEPAERQRVADETRAVFERLGAKPYLAQLDAALEGASPTDPQPASGRSVPAADEVRLG